VEEASGVRLDLATTWPATDGSSLTPLGSETDASADKVKIVVFFEPVDPAVSLKSAAVALSDEKGRLSAQATANPANLTRTPPVLAAVAKPGTYRMRVAATDANGRGGTVDVDLKAELMGADALKLGSLVLGVAEEGTFAGRLQFCTEPTAVAYLEIYGVTKGALSADLELADSESGPASVRGAMRITGQASDDLHLALGGIPIGSLSPGDIVVRAVVSLDGKPIGRVVQTLRKAKQPARFRSPAASASGWPQAMV
jgi:hypothetical protein